MKRKNGSLKLSFLVLILAGCSGLTHRRNDAAIAKVRRVAVAGFASVQPAPALSVPKTNGKVEEMYAAFSETFAKRSHWQVLPAATMKSNPAYRAAWDRTMKGFQNKSLPRQKERKFTVDEIMDSDSIRILDTAGRSQLMKALGVDALVATDVDVMVNGGAVFGIGSLRPQARVSFKVYVAGANNFDWFEGDLLGEEATESVGSTGFFDADKLAVMGLVSAKTAFKKISRSAP